MTPDQVWVPVQRRWADIRPGDVCIGRDDRPWMVTRPSQPPLTGWRMQHGQDEFNVQPNSPDAEVTVLVPMPERDALQLLGAQLGAQPLEAVRS